MRRTPLKRSTKPIKRSAIKVKAPKGQGVWRKARTAVLERCGGICEARGVGCVGIAVHVHHICRRSQGGTNELSNLLGLCFVCHQWIHEHPAISKERGWLG